jgi:hypothetical protein
MKDTGTRHKLLRHSRGVDERHGEFDGRCGVRAGGE